jgi:hypothetical protein
MRWVELREICIVTNDAGPFLPDVFWVFRSAAGEIRFPTGSIGEKPVMDRALDLPGFNMERFTAAMGSTDNAEFLVWRKPSAAAETDAR